MRGIKTGLLVIVLLLVMPSPVLADSSRDVTVTATGYICGVPGGLTLTYISDYEIGISWTKGADAENTMVRGAVGRAPENRTDGFLVYYGDGVSTSDTGVSLDETAAPVYYRVWSQNAAGVWEEAGIGDSLEGFGMTTIAIIILVLGITLAAFFLKSGMLFAMCIPAWLLFTFYMFNINWPAENAYLPTAIALFGVAMVIVMLAATAMHYIGNRSSEPTYDEEKAANLKKIYHITHRRLPWE